MTITPTPGGWVATCECGWERYEARRPTLDAARAKHTCPKRRRA